MYAELKRAWGELTAPGQLFEVERAPVRGVEILSYRHAPPSLREVWLSTAGHAERDYLVYGDERIT
ncbi:MAG: AMP-dependent synthetase, partial [Pseudomonadota bacterium]